MNRNKKELEEKLEAIGEALKALFDYLELSDEHFYKLQKRVSKLEGIEFKRRAENLIAKN